MFELTDDERSGYAFWRHLYHRLGGAERMWMIDNLTPYAVERTWARDIDGRHLWIVALKATFDIGPSGVLHPSATQPEPRIEPEYRGDPGLSSLLADAELVPLRPSTDVLVSGAAYAPRGRPVREVDVRLRVADIDKTLVVCGDRTYIRDAGGVKPSEPAEFLRLPIEYERAFGGVDLREQDPSSRRFDPRNPVGRGFCTQASALVGTPAPNIVYPGAEPTRGGPAGFGPIPGHWSPRRELAGTYDEAWFTARRPLLPLDFKDGFYSCAPPDQRPSRSLGGGERIELTNMSRDGSLVCTVPRMELHFATYFGRRRLTSPSFLTCVVIEPDAPRLSVLWQTQLTVGPKDVERLDRTSVELRTGAP